MSINRNQQHYIIMTVIYNELNDFAMNGGKVFRDARDLTSELCEMPYEEVDNFIDELIETYYLTLGKGKLINYFLQKGFLYAIIYMTFYIANSSFMGSNVVDYSFAAVIMGSVGFIGGIIFIFICMLLIKTLSGRNYLYPIVPFNLRGFLELFIRYPTK